MFHDNLHVDYYLCPRDNLKKDFFETFPMFRHPLVISEQNDTGR